jgi:hypothetical protein
MRLCRPAASGRRRTKIPFDEQQDVYRFNIPPADDSQPADGAKAQIRLEVWPDEQIQNRLSCLAERSRKADEVLKGDLEQAAEKFLQECLDYLASNTQSFLTEKAAQFTNVTHGITYFQGFTAITAEAFKRSLEAHKEAYDRYKENLVAVMLELLFYSRFGEQLVEKIFGRVIREGKEAAEKQLKAEAKTLAQAAAEEAETALLPKMNAEKLARDRALTEYAKLTTKAAEVWHESEVLVAKLGETEAAKAAAEKEAEELAKRIQDFTGTQVRPGVRIPLSVGGGGAANSTIDLSAVVSRYTQAKNSIADLERSIADTAKKIDICDASVRAKLQSLTTQLDKFIEAESKHSSFAVQAELLAKVKRGAASEKQFEDLLEQAVRATPKGHELGQQVLKTLENEKGIALLHQYKNELEALRATTKQPRSIARLETKLAEVEQVLSRVEKADATAETIMKQYVGWTADFLKENFNEKAKKLREQLDALAHADFGSEFKKLFDNSYWRGFCDVCAAAFETVGEIYKWLPVEEICKWLEDAASSAETWARSAATSDDSDLSDVISGLLVLTLEGALRELRDLGGGVLKYLGEMSFGALTALVVLVDMILQLLMKVSEFILWFANCPRFASSMLDEKARFKVEKCVIALPAKLPDDFFAFSKDAVCEVAKAVDPKKLMERSGGKQAIGDSIKQEFSGAYEKYYEPQWKYAREFMLGLAGSSGSLDPKWLDSPNVQSNNREATRLLQTILTPLDRYLTAFTRPGDQKLGTFDSLVTEAYYLGETGEWTPHDVDMIFEKLSSAINLATKIIAAGLMVGGLVFGCVPVVALSAEFAAAGVPNDQIWAFCRLWTVMFFTMPHVLGIQFDVMRAYSLSYQAVFYGADLSDSLADKPMPAWQAEVFDRAMTGGPLG